MLYEKLNQQKYKIVITIERLSRLSGVPVGTINKILRGETKFPRYDTLQALEKVLFADCSSEWKENGSAGNHANDLIQETLEYLTKQQEEYSVPRISVLKWVLIPAGREITELKFRNT